MYLGSYDFDCFGKLDAFNKIAQHLKSAFTIFIDELSIHNSPTDLVELRKKIQIKYTPAPRLADATIEYFIGDRKIQDINEFIQNTVCYGKGDSTLIYFYKTKNWTIFIDEDKVYILDQTFHIADIPSSLSIMPSDTCITFKNSQYMDVCCTTSPSYISNSLPPPEITASGELPLKIARENPNRVETFSSTEQITEMEVSGGYIVRESCCGNNIIELHNLTKIEFIETRKDCKITNRFLNAYYNGYQDYHCMNWEEIHFFSENDGKVYEITFYNHQNKLIRKSISSEYTGDYKYCKFVADYSHYNIQMVGHNEEKDKSKLWIDKDLAKSLDTKLNEILGTDNKGKVTATSIFKADKEKLLDWFKENHIAENYKNEAIDEFKKATTNEIAKALGEQIKDLKSYHEHREELFDIIETVITSNLAKVNKIAYDNNGHPLVSFETTKEEKSMFDNIFGKYEFGEVKDGAIKYTPNGLAMRDSCGDYVVYKDGTGTNMSNLTMDIPLFKMPVALVDIKPGDIIVHFGAGNSAYVKVEEIKKDSIVCIDPFQKQRIELVPESNLFGFQFVVKVVSPISMDTIKPNESNPFGNLLPFMLMGKDNKSDDYFKYLMMMQMCGNTQFNPMMFMLMDKDGDNDFFKYMLMMQMGGIDIPTRPEVSE